MTLRDLAYARLHNQQIAATRFDDPVELVTYMGALQAQDYPMSVWAAGLRVRDCRQEDIVRALDAGALARTHVLRPTWHLVAGKDLRWMLELTRRHIKAASAARRRELGLDEPLLARSIDVIQKTLEGGKHLTREELMQSLEQHGIQTDAHRAVYFMFETELNGIVCNGKMRGSKQTYALIDEKVPPGPRYDREESLYLLAQRYFNSHGPATLADFQWWSGLPAGDARKALDMIRPEFRSVQIDGMEYWFRPDSVFEAHSNLHLLPAFDEYTVSYKYRSAVMPAHLQSTVVTANGIFKPIIVHDSQVVGLWKRTTKKQSVLIEPDLFEADPGKHTGIREAAEAYGRFLGVKAEW